MAITSIFGISSGFDTASLVEKLIALQARPMDLKLAQVQAKETKLEAFQSLRTHLQTFQSVLNSMGTVDRFNVTTADFTVTAGKRTQRRHLQLRQRRHARHHRQRPGAGNHPVVRHRLLRQHRLDRAATAYSPRPLFF